MNEERASDPAVDLRLFKQLWSDLVEQHHELSEFKLLFYTSPARVDLLNRIAKHFFGELFYILLDRLALGVCKLTDPPQSMGKPNLSFPSVHESLSADPRYPKEEVEVLLGQTRRVREHFAPWRNKRISHKDLAVALGDRELGEVVPGRLEEFFTAAQDYVTLVGERLGLGPMPIDTPGIHGADELVKALKQASTFNELFHRSPIEFHEHLRANQFRDA